MISEFFPHILRLTLIRLTLRLRLDSSFLRPESVYKFYFSVPILLPHNHVDWNYFKVLQICSFLLSLGSISFASTLKLLFDILGKKTQRLSFLKPVPCYEVGFEKFRKPNTTTYRNLRHEMPRHRSARFMDKQTNIVKKDCRLSTEKFNIILFDNLEMYAFFIIV
jgi:hypothetical protein